MKNFFSAEFENDDVRAALAEISRRSGKTILPERNVNGTLTGLVQKLDFTEGLSQLLKSNGFLLRKEGNTFIVEKVISDGNNSASRRGLWVRSEKGRLKLEINNSDLGVVLNEISRQSGANFFLMGEPKGKVNAQAGNLTLEEALGFVLMNSGFTYKKSGGVYLIGDKQNKGLIASRLIHLKHLKVDSAIEVLPKKVAQTAEISVVKEHNALLVNASRDVLDEIEAIVAKLDRPIPQIFIEALVVDFRKNDSRDISLSAQMGNNVPGDTSGSVLQSFTQWLPGVNLIRSGQEINKQLDGIDKKFKGLNVGRLPSNFYVQLRALEEKGRANIRSRPQISTLNGHKAELKIGETRYFKLVSETPIRDPGNIFLQTTERFQTVEINISLTITPWVSASGEITVEIEPEFNTPAETNAVSGIPPNIRSRSLKSTVRLKDGETIVLGGLIEEIEEESRSGIPIISKLPMVGRFFSSTSHNKEKNELIIYVTPHLSYTDGWMQP